MKYRSFSSYWHFLRQGETEEVKCSVKPQSQEKKVAIFRFIRFQVFSVHLILYLKFPKYCDKNI